MKAAFDVLIVLVLIWLGSHLMLSTSSEDSFTYLTGMVPFAMMSLAMILATRARWAERFVGGLDKGYKLHRHLGSLGFAVAVVHFIGADFGEQDEDSETLAGEFSAKISENIADVFGTSTAEQTLPQFADLASNLGDIGFHLIALLTIVAVIKKIPYRFFAKTHKLMPVAYLLLALHAVVLVPPRYWPTPFGILLITLLILGSGSALYILAGGIGRSRSAVGKITAITPYPKMKALDVAIAIDGDWQGHKEGQFAFLSCPHDNEPHPFTISSAWRKDQGLLRFTIKALGDYTKVLPSSLRLGDRVKIEGPYGQFDFRDDSFRQIWIAGGIGITPFLARLQGLAQKGNDIPIDLFYVASGIDQEFLGKIENLAAKARVTLHDFTKSRRERFCAADVQNLSPHWRDASIWYCGPAGLGQTLRATLTQDGLDKRHFHQEEFAFR